MEKLEYALKVIANCDFCNGIGATYWGNGEDYFDYETCVCNPYELILDESGDVIFDNGLLSQDELSIFATQEAN